MVCGIVKGSNNKQMKKKIKISVKLTDSLKRIKQALRALVSEKVHCPFLNPRLLL